MKIFFSVGEPSGDQHAAHLIAELRRRRPDIECVGYGGPLMERAGCRLDYPLTNLAVMGFFRVIPMLWKFIRLARQARRILRETCPDAVLLVDFPGFNWWIARYAKRLGIPVFYYLPPQLWAWASWRVERIRKFVDHVLCGLPFEETWYAERGIKVEYVGHPFFDEVADHVLDTEFMTSHEESGIRDIGILPGSRHQEVTRCFPVMLEVMRRVHRAHPDVRFIIACYKPAHRMLCERMVQATANNFPIELHVGKTSEIIEHVTCCLMVSGSVSLELLARGTPAVVLYRPGWITSWIAQRLIKCRFISLPNLFVDRAILPEFPSTGKLKHDLHAMASILSGWMTDPSLLELSRTELACVRDRFIATGATARTAACVLENLESPDEQRCEAA
jgi:lipid-A-disaccharide synthase